MTTITRSRTFRRITAVTATAVVTALAAAGIASATSAGNDARVATEVAGTTERLAPLGDAGLVDRLAADLPVFHRAGEAPNGTGTGSWASMYDFLETVLIDADGFWTGILVGAGLPEPWVNYQLPAPGEVVGTACSPGYSDDSSMFYCPADDLIVFSQDIATRLWDGTYVGPDGQALGYAGGDFAVAFLVAHEMAHSIQNEVGIAAQFSVPQREKHADCWSGVWARSASDRGLLDPGDVEEGLNGAFLVGDSHFDNPGHHGTSAQRMEAFSIGFDSGAPISCDVFLV